MVLSGTIEPDLGDDGAPLLDDDLAVLINAWWEPRTFVVTWDGGRAVTIESDSFDPNRRGGLVAGG